MRALPVVPVQVAPQPPIEARPIRPQQLLVGLDEILLQRAVEAFRVRIHLRAVRVSMPARNAAPPGAVLQVACAPNASWIELAQEPVQLDWYS